MKTICKYKIPENGFESGATSTLIEFTLEIPDGGKLLEICVQDGKPCMWFLVNTESPKTPRYFCVFCTGQELPDDKRLTYIGMYQRRRFVGQVFELVPAIRKMIEAIL